MGGGVFGGVVIGWVGSRERGWGVSGRQFLGGVKDLPSVWLPLNSEIQVLLLLVVEVPHGGGVGGDRGGGQQRGF